MLDPEQQRALFSLAHAAIEAYLDRGDPPPLPHGPGLDEPRGVFVTLRKGSEHELRGCIGYTVAHLPLAEAVRELAARSAFRDRRFAPVSRAELPELSVEISVLTPLERADPDRIEVGVHGLHVHYGERSGLLLPQVASERRWDAQTFLEATCQKAGLPQDAWRRPEAELSWFRCEVYEE
ncbi:MAG: AmmeMemoRadiSam system protein A [Planctomycetota bacterium]